MKIAVLITCLFLAAAPADVIVSLNFDRDEQILASTDVTGVVPVANWNHWDDGDFGTARTNLVDSTGGVLDDLTVTLSGNVSGRRRNTSGTNPLNVLLDDGVGPGTTGTTVISLTGVSSVFATTYDLYLYGWENGNDTNTKGISFTVDGNTLYVRGDQPEVDVAGFLEGAAVFASTKEGANYVRFSGLSGDQSITMEIIGGGRSSLTGLQLVGAAIPEPSSALLVLLAVGLLANRRHVGGRPSR